MSAERVPMPVAVPGPGPATPIIGSAAEPSAARNTRPAQHDLFASPVHPAVEKLQTLDPDSLTPRQALDCLYELKRSL